MIKEFYDFLNEDRNTMYRLYIDNEIFEDISWDITLDFSDLWDKYQKNEIGIERFIKDYKFRVNEYKDKITQKKGVDVWNELVLILNDFKSYESVTMHKKMDQVYDWADKNNIEIKTKI